MQMRKNAASVCLISIIWTKLMLIAQRIQIYSYIKWVFLNIPVVTPTGKPPFSCQDVNYIVAHETLTLLQFKETASRVKI